MNKQMPTNTRDPVTAPNALPDSFYRNAPVTWKGYSGGEKCVVDKVSLGGRRRGGAWLGVARCRNSCACSCA